MDPLTDPAERAQTVRQFLASPVWLFLLRPKLLEDIRQAEAVRDAAPTPAELWTAQKIVEKMKEQLRGLDDWGAAMTRLLSAKK